LRQVTLYTADGCSLCARALEVVREAQAELGFRLEVVDIGGDPALEAAYREVLPAVEIDGERAFTYFVDPGALRVRLAVLPAAPEEPLAES
jgi:glutaredoxin